MQAGIWDSGLKAVKSVEGMQCIDRVQFAEGTAGKPGQEVWAWYIHYNVDQTYMK